MNSAKEICLKQYHAELAQKQIVWDLPNRLADCIGVSRNEFSMEDFLIIIDIGRAMAWSKTFDRIIRAIAEEFNKDLKEEMEMHYHEDL